MAGVETDEPVERVTLEEPTLHQYERFSLFNSPYPAHNRGCAIDLYPGDERALSPVSGTVLETKTVRAPPKPYSPEHDHLVLLECLAPAPVAGLIARILHVDPVVEPGEEVAIGDDLGTLVRAGFFAPWVADHLHVEFRPPERNPHRASGSVPIDVDLDLRALEWDGTGTVLETGETYAILDSPVHPSPGEVFAGIAADGGGVLDGGLPHYDCGGLLAGPAGSATLEEIDRFATPDGVDSAVTLEGHRLGTATGRTIDWDDLTVLANGEPVTGLSLCCARDAAFGAKVICPGHEFALGDRLAMTVHSPRP